MKLQFLGAARQVTGSQYYVEADGARVLVDCGMYQERAYLARNWDPSPVRLRDLHAILLTHAHVDHCGLAPKLVREGYRGPIIATSASADLAALVLRDAAEIQVEDAAFKEKRHRKEGRRDKTAVQPLYTGKDVDRTLPLLESAAYDRPVRINNRVQAVFHDAGHILGSAIIEVRVSDHGTPRRILFTGDLGQWDRPIVRDPTVFTEADYVIMESTYGDRNHENHDTVGSQLEKVILETIGRGGKVVVPIFAIERAQELIYHLSKSVDAGRIPAVPVFLDSPMAADVNDVFRRHRECFDAEAERLTAGGQSWLKFPSFRVLRTVEQSMTLNKLSGPAVIMATSGMCTAGRIKHHLAHHIGDPSSTILFVGYQSEGTLGRQILDGNREVRIHGLSRLVRAQVRQIQGISGHADRAGLLKWLSYFRHPPLRLFVTHGEPEASLSLAEHVRQEMGWNVTVPEYRETVELKFAIERRSVPPAADPTDLTAVGDRLFFAATDTAHGKELWTFYNDHTPPTVTSISPSTAGPVIGDGSRAVEFTVVFDETVSNVSTDDFRLTATGAATGTIASVAPSSGSGTSFTVTVGTITGNGTLRLDLKDGSDAQDAAGNLATGYTAGGTVSVSSLPDAILDGTVDIQDLSALLASYNHGGLTWPQGDFTGDGVADIDDLSKVLTSYNHSMGSSAAGAKAAAATAGQSSGKSAGETGADAVPGTSRARVAVLAIAGAGVQKPILAIVSAAHDREFQARALDPALGSRASLGDLDAFANASQRSKKHDPSTRAVDAAFGEG